eukprot:Skav227971  [mRNA]  locus=scaffold5474:45005:45292:+ [translate_table: standard]
MEIWLGQWSRVVPGNGPSSVEDKLSCFANAVRRLENLLVERVFAAGAAAGGSETESSWIKLLAALILKASPPNLYSNLEFTTSFRHPSRMTPEDC